MDSVLADQPKPFELPLVLRAALDKINARRLDGAVAEQIRKFYNIAVRTVICRCEQVPQIVREHLRRCNARSLTQPLHCGPDLPPVHAFSVRGEKDLTAGDFLLLGVFQQLAAELCGQQNCPDLALERDLGTAALRGLNGEICLLYTSDAADE